MSSQAAADAKKFLEDILAFFGLNVDVGFDVEDDTVQLDVPSTHMNGFLIGQRGENLKSLQYLVNLSLNANGHEDTRVNIDIADYKKNRADRLKQDAKEWAEEVQKTGEPYEVRPMSAYDRRIVHKAVSEIEGLETESLGKGRGRHVVIKKSE